MILQAWILFLEKMIEPEKKDISLPIGLSDPHSYRGFYDELAFRPCRNITPNEMLEEARSCVGKVFTGYQGGEYTMTKETRLWVARYGETGFQLSGKLADYICQTNSIYVDSFTDMEDYAVWKMFND